MTKKILLKCKKEFILKLIVTIALRGCLMVIPILYSFTVNEITNANYKTAYTMLAISVIITIIYRFSEHHNQKAYYKLYSKIYDKYTDIALSYTHSNSIYSLSRFSLGEYTNIFNNDIDVISTFWSTSVIRVIQLLEFVFIYFYFFAIDAYVGMLTVLISVAAFFIMLRYGNRIEVLNKNRKEALDKKTGVLQEIFLGIKEIKALNLVDSIQERLNKTTNDYLNANTKYNIKYYKNKFIAIFFVEFSRLLLFIYGVYLISIGHMEIGVLLVIYNYYTKLIENLGEIGTVNMEFRNLNTSISRVNKLIEYSSNIDQGIEELNDKLPGEIIFDNVLYGNIEDPYLKDVSFTIKSKRLTVITGKVGNDKSGVYDLLLRLNRQHNGTITIDDIDIKDYSLDAYYDLVSAAREQSIFFNMSIKENLQIIDPDFAKIVAVCKKLNIHDYIMNLKKGYDTVLTTSADNVNVDIKQLLSIARVFLKDSKVMLFDDIMSSLDDEALKNVLTIINEKKTTHTVVIITNNDEIINLADDVIKLENGTIK